MLSDDVQEKGFALLCMAQPRTDVEVVTCNEVRGPGRRGGGCVLQGGRIDLTPRQPLRGASCCQPPHPHPPAGLEGLTPLPVCAATQEELLDVQLCA
jgi:hypothetical protein